MSGLADGCQVWADGPPTITHPMANDALGKRLPDPLEDLALDDARLLNLQPNPIRTKPNCFTEKPLIDVSGLHTSALEIEVVVLQNVRKEPGKCLGDSPLGVVVV